MTVRYDSEALPGNIPDMRETHGGVICLHKVGKNRFSSQIIVISRSTHMETLSVLYQSINQ